MLDDPFKWVHLPTATDDRGSLTYVEGEPHIPFDIERVYYIHNTPAGAIRGGHAHKELEQVIVCLHGSVTMILDAGDGKQVQSLDSATDGLYTPPMTWREMHFSPDTVLLVFASEKHDPDDYIRDYDDFKDQVSDES